MEVIVKKNFPKAVKSTPKLFREAVKEVIAKLVAAKNLETSGLDYTKIEGQRKGENYLRIRVGDWRIGAAYINPKVLLITILTRGSIYKQFPPKK
jgi:mRNA interferase RelE/StbE